MTAAAIAPANNGMQKQIIVKGLKLTFKKNSYLLSGM